MNSLKKRGRPRRNMTETDRLAVIACDNGELTFRECAKRLHVANSTLYRWIDEVRAEKK